MSWGVKTTCFKVPGVSLGGSGVSIGGIRILRVVGLWLLWLLKKKRFPEYVTEEDFNLLYTTFITGAPK